MHAQVSFVFPNSSNRKIRAFQMVGCIKLCDVVDYRGAELEGCKYRHPLFERDSPVVLGGDYITTDSGTGLVHTAPGHGQEDYQVRQC